MSQPPMPPGPPREPQPQSWPQLEMQPLADRSVDHDKPATDAASTPVDESASIAGWTQPPWTIGPDAPAGPDALSGWTPPPWIAGPDAFWRRIPVGLLIVALVLAGAVAGWYLHGIEQPGSIAQPATGESDLGELPRYEKLRVDLRVGDCYNLTGDQWEDVKEVPCSTKHELEVIYVGAMGEGSYPTSDGFVDYVIDYCDPAFADYVGKSVDDSDFEYDWLVPTQDAWRSGDRTVRCAAYEPGSASLTRSIRGARQ